MKTANEQPTEGSPELDQKSLATSMLDFSKQIPASAGLDWVKDWEFLYYFEAERLLTMRQALLDSGFSPQSSFSVLDFGYLHGLVPEFLHRFFPKAHFTVLDHPNSPNFQNSNYMEMIKSRTYLKLEPCDISRVGDRDGVFDLIVLGEIIEHLDPTFTATAASLLRQKISANGCLLITTPNGAGIKNLFFTLIGRDAQHPVIPDPTMNYGHIHLWTHPLLEKTMEHYSWKNERIYFTHGFDRWAFEKSNHHWGSLRHQVLIKGLYMAAQLFRKWRGFMVSTWKPAPASEN
jgi:2-polyprenyl-3-methyl-5-hydroxy-6-metoxy-1,4-benzoquinol methylase